MDFERFFASIDDSAAIRHRAMFEQVQAQGKGLQPLFYEGRDSVTGQVRSQAGRVVLSTNVQPQMGQVGMGVGGFDVGARRSPRVRKKRLTYPDVKILATCISDGRRRFYVGGDRLIPIEVLDISIDHRLEEFDIGIENLGKGKDEWIVFIKVREDDLAHAIIHVIYGDGREPWSIRFIDSPFFGTIRYRGAGYWTNWQLDYGLLTQSISAYEGQLQIDEGSYTQQFNPANPGYPLTFTINRQFRWVPGVTKQLLINASYVGSFVGQYDGIVSTHSVERFLDNGSYFFRSLSGYEDYISYSGGGEYSINSYNELNIVDGGYVTPSGQKKNFQLNGGKPFQSFQSNASDFEGLPILKFFDLDYEDDADPLVSAKAWTVVRRMPTIDGDYTQDTNDQRKTYKTYAVLLPVEAIQQSIIAIG